MALKIVWDLAPLSEVLCHACRDASPSKGKPIEQSRTAWDHSDTSRAAVVLCGLLADSS